MQLSTFLTYLRRDFRRDDKDTEITQAYNDSILAISLLMPHNGYKYQSYISCVDSQEDYPLPSGVVHVIHPVRFLEGSGTNDSGYALEHYTKQKWDKEEINPNRTSPSTGKPSKYTIFAGSILVSNIPNSADYLLELDWTKQATDQSAATDTPGLEDTYREVLKWMALDRLYSGLGLTQESMEWRSRYQDAEGNPIGLLKKLLDIERDKEGWSIGKVENNQL